MCNAEAEQLQFLNLIGRKRAPTLASRSQRRFDVGPCRFLQNKGDTIMGQIANYDTWSASAHYEHYMGRWSREIADQFLRWLDPRPQLDWLELGCGTGALSSATLRLCSPRSTMITDFSDDFLKHTEHQISDPRAKFEIADAQALPFPAAQFDVAVSGLTLNFIPDRALALTEMQRVTKPGGTIAFYVWDYPGGGMGFIDAFWSAVAEVTPAASDLDEASRFPFCTPDGLTALCKDAGLQDVQTTTLETETVFPDFEAFWHPFTLGTGPAPGYCSTLSEADLAALKHVLERTVGQEGPIRLPARAWAVTASRT